MTETAASYQGLYINLDRSPERRERIERQLQTFGLENTYRRFPGVDGGTLNLAGAAIRPGEAGCFHSHYRALESVRRSGTCVHVLEDDAVLSAHVRPAIEDAAASGLFDRFDIVFTDMLVGFEIAALKGMKALFDRTAAASARTLRLNDLSVIDLSRQNFACTTSLVVSGKAIDRILALYKQAIDAGPRLPVDLFIRECVHAGKLRAACLFPFVTSFDLNEIAATTVAGGAAPRPSVTVLAALRYSYFIGRDLALAKTHMDAATRTNRAPRDAHHDLIVQALEFVMSDDFKEF